MEKRSRSLSNYRVSPRAETVFQILRMRDDSTIDKALFYCLVVEGELICGTPRKSPSALSIPRRIRDRAEGIYESDEFQTIRHFFANPKIRSLRYRCTTKRQARPRHSEVDRTGELCSDCAARSAAYVRVDA